MAVGVAVVGVAAGGSQPEPGSAALSRLPPCPFDASRSSTVKAAMWQGSHRPMPKSVLLDPPSSFLHAPPRSRTATTATCSSTTRDASSTLTSAWRCQTGGGGTDRRHEEHRLRRSGRDRLPSRWAAASARRGRGLYPQARPASWSNHRGRFRATCEPPSRSHPPSPPLALPAPSLVCASGPGGVNFQSAPFKLTREPLEVMDFNSNGKPSELL